MDKNLNVRHETIKLLAEIIGKSLLNTSMNNFFPGHISGKGNKIKNEQVGQDYIKLKSFRTAKDTISRIKRQLTVWQNIFLSDLFNEGLISKYMKNSYNPTPRKQITQLKNGWKT